MLCLTPQLSLRQLQYFVTKCRIKSVPPPMLQSCAVTLYGYAGNKCYFKANRQGKSFFVSHRLM